ncbi:Ribophorin I [Syncephalis fuscata]|nr:Ribophorin I [Syncephalis fuscata]
MWSNSTRLFALTTFAVLSIIKLAEAALADPMPVKLSNYELHRSVNLKTPGMVDIYNVVVENNDKTPADTYYIAIEGRTAITIAYEEAKRDINLHDKKGEAAELKNKLDKKQLIREQKIKHEPKYSDNKWVVYSIALDPPLASDDKTSLSVKFYHTNKALLVQPKHVLQDKSQYLRWESSATIYSPYFSKSQKISVEVPSEYIEGYSKAPEPVNRDKKYKEVTYGPYTDVQAKAAKKPIYVHYEQNTPPITAIDHKRQLEVSHWGGYLSVEEHYQIRHDGAQLDGEFSRIKYQKTSHMLEITPVLNSIPAKLPKSAERIYYRDPIGNVSTSSMELTNQGHSDKQLKLDMRPRFPLYGEWQYRFYYGFEQPLFEVLSQVPGTNTYVLRVPFINCINTWTYETSELRILLPEGASNVQVHVPFSLDSKRISKFRTYLDVTGRTAIWLTKHNAIDKHDQFIEITYEYSFFDLMRKPLGVFAAFMAVFTFAMFYSRLDLSIARK